MTDVLETVKNKKDLYIQIEQVIKPTADARSKNAEILTPIFNTP